MAKIDLKALTIDELVTLRDAVIERLAEKVAARQAELEAEMERLSQYGKPAKKSQAAGPVTKAKKTGDRKHEDKHIVDVNGDEASPPIAEAA